MRHLREPIVLAFVCALIATLATLAWTMRIRAARQKPCGIVMVDNWRVEKDGTRTKLPNIKECY